MSVWISKLSPIPILVLFGHQKNTNTHDEFCMAWLAQNECSATWYLQMYSYYNFSFFLFLGENYCVARWAFWGWVWEECQHEHLSGCIYCGQLQQCQYECVWHSGMYVSCLPHSTFLYFPVILKMCIQKDFTWLILRHLAICVCVFIWFANS